MTDTSLVERLRVLVRLKSQAPLHDSSEAEGAWVAQAADRIESLERECAELRRDAQAMALVKMFPEQSLIAMSHAVAASRIEHATKGKHACTADLNAAVVECVSKMQAAKVEG